jgi:PAS domain S-box-containing protein
MPPMQPAQNPVEALLRDQRRVRRALWLLNLGVAASLVVLATLSLGGSREVYTARVRDATENLAIGLQASIEARLAQVDVGLRHLRDELARNQGHAQLQAMLAGERTLAPFVDEVGIVSARGSVSVVEGRVLPIGTDLSAQAFFVAARDATHDRAVLSEPLQLGADTRWRVLLARRLAGADGRFDGIVYALIPVEHFERLLGSVDVGQQGAATLRSASLRLVARHTPVRGDGPTTGSSRISGELTAALARDPAQGSYVATTVLDGVERSNAYRRLQDYPMLVLAGLGTREFYAPWRAQVAAVAALMAALAVVLGAASVVGYRHWVRARRNLQARVEEGERSRALLRTSSDGIHVLDREGRLVELSDSFARMLGHPREALLGQHVSLWDARLDRHCIDDWLQAFPVGENQRFETRHRRIDGSLIDVEIEARATPIGGDDKGLIYCAARDVTERKRLLRQQKAMLDNDLIGMTLLRDRRGVWANRALERIFGYGPGEMVGLSSRVLYPDEEAFQALGVAAYGVLREGGRYRTQIQMRRKNGEPVWIDLSGVMLSPDEALWMMVDISALKAHHAQV